ncbi:DUF6244 family protein [Longispora sp. NPDC051575]|uniref:DUF6244 family protein n=1 Tax=Longispora sp. NPDC051575 TaxID=3154943 RepID=UPI00342EE8AA
MSTPAEILTALTGAETGLDQARTQVSGARDHADKVFAQARAMGLSGVANSMARVITCLDDALNAFAAAITSVRDSRGPVSQISPGLTPAEVKTRLTSSIGSIDAAITSISAAFDELDETEPVIRQALDGGDPAPLLAFIGNANTTATEGRNQARTAKTKAQELMPQTSTLGN